MYRHARHVGEWHLNDCFRRVFKGRQVSISTIGKLRALRGEQRARVDENLHLADWTNLTRRVNVVAWIA